MNTKKALSVKCKIFMRISKNYNLSQSQQQTRATGIQEGQIRMSINLYVENTSEKPQHILRTHKIRSTFQTENTLCKPICKVKDRVAIADKNSIVNESDYSYSEDVYFDEN